MPIRQHIFEACVPTSAQVIPHRGRKVQDVPVVHRVGFGVRVMDRDEAPVALRVEASQHPHSKNTLRYFDGSIWRPFACYLPDRHLTSVDMSAFGLIVGGTINDTRNAPLVFAPRDAKLDWLGYKEIVDSGVHAAERAANAIAEQFVFIDDCLYRKEDPPQHMIGVNLPKDVVLGRQITHRYEAVEGRLAVMLPLSQAARALELELALAERYGIGDYESRAVQWRLEVLLPEAFEVDASREAALDVEAILQAVGRCSFVWALSTDLGRLWVRVRQEMERPKPDLVNVLERLVEFTDALIDGPVPTQWFGYRELTRHAAAATTLIGTFLSVSDFLDDHDRKAAMRLSDRYDFSSVAQAA